MKYYKKENNKFLGFYDSEIHGDILFDENGKLKENYFELSEQDWETLLDGQSDGKEIRILKNGELGLFEKPQAPQDFYRPIWNDENEVWEEGADANSLMDERVELIKKYRELKKEIAMLKEEGDLDPEFASPKTIEKKEKELKEVRIKIIELKKVVESL